ncbi:DNA cytosine methyltransferase [Rhizobium leguminosarum]|uniref:DNA cytosine methyltransferase n=1 Tax=Rhizobium leguminosarum TaxID=384 RepID=UPI0014419FF5|nr:DNA cytosine methyltransferase [Rhizobium leguminosarum]NKJ77737.1 DNA cytosine methyltransferase [Rhizobium leguminosarum bv. viciae]
MKDPHMRFAELFAGIGGLGLGLEQADLQPLTGYERWDKAVDVWQFNNKSKAFKIDLGNVAEAALHIMGASPQMIVGGPPCQDFSEAGKGILGENAAMTQAYAMIIAIVRPEWFVFENTRRAPLSLNYRQARTIWKRAGYGLSEILLDASYYGTPQSRKRFFCIGRLCEVDGFLDSAIIEAASKRQVPVRSVLDPDRFPDDAELIRRGGYFVRPYTGGKGVHRLDRPAPTIIHTSTGRPNKAYRDNPHPTDHMPYDEAFQLTAHQAMRIQGFPADFEIVGTQRLKKGKDSYAKHDTMQMIANAVPPPLAEKIGEVILARAEGRSIPALDAGFQAFLLERFPPKEDEAQKPKRKQKGKPEKAQISPNMANIKSRVNRARRLLHGRTYQDIALELAELEDTAEFASLDVRTKSDLRAALRLYHEYMSSRPLSKYARKIEKLEKGEKPKPVVPDFGRRPHAADGSPTDVAPSESSGATRLRRRYAPQTPADEPSDFHVDVGPDLDPRHEPDVKPSDSDRLVRDE